MYHMCTQWYACFGKVFVFSTILFKDRAILWDIDGADAAFLLSVIGISNTVARLALGWLSDRSWINRLYLYNSCLVICGISMSLSPFMTTYNLQAVYCAIFGITSGAYVGLTSVVLVDLLGLDKLTNAFGLLLMFQGIASVIGPPVIGEISYLLLPVLIYTLLIQELYMTALGTMTQASTSRGA